MTLTAWRQLLLRNYSSLEGWARAGGDCCWCDFELKSLNQYSTVSPTNSYFGTPDQNKLFHKTESDGGWERMAEWICSLISILQILNQICLQPYISQVSLLLGGLNKNSVIPFQSSQNHSWEREKNRFATDSCLSCPSKKEQRCLFQSSVDEIQNCVSIGRYR